MIRNTSLKLDRQGFGTFIVDGVDVSMSVAPEFTVTGKSGATPVLTVNLVGMNLEVEADADVVIPEDVATVLEALGWTRPTEDEVSA